MTILARYDWSDLELHVSKEPNTGCWLWERGMTTAGYGLVYLGADGSRYAHRISYERAKGAIPAGMVIDHLCHTRACINPDHLRVLTRGENILAPGSLSPSGQNKAKKNCPRCGSEYGRDGAGRRCWTCRKEYERIRSRLRRAAA